MPSRRWRPRFGTLPQPSRAALHQLVSGRTLRLAKLGADHDRYGRLVAFQRSAHQGCLGLILNSHYATPHFPPMIAPLHFVFLRPFFQLRDHFRVALSGTVWSLVGMLVFELVVLVPRVAAKLVVGTRLPSVA